MTDPTQISSRTQALRFGDLHGKKYAERYLSETDEHHIGAINKQRKLVVRSGMMIMKDRPSVPDRWKAVVEQGFTKSADRTLEIYAQNLIPTAS